MASHICFMVQTVMVDGLTGRQFTAKRVNSGTGAAQGMGAEHARRFISEGAKTVFTDINEEAGSALQNELGDDAFFVRHDVGNERDWEKLVVASEGRFGPVSVLMNNAGIIGPAVKADHLALKDYERVCRVNQTSVFLGTKHVIPSMIRAGGGSIVNVSSISRIVAIYGTPNVAYAASKFAVRGITKMVAIEYGDRGIRANSVHPGYIRTPMMTEALNDEQINFASASVPIHRIGEVEDVSNLVAFLASDEAGFITGSEYVIDGGLTAQ